MDFATRFSCSLALINRLPWYGRTLVRAPAEHAVLPRSAPENGACQPVQAQRGDETPQPEQEPSTTLAQSGQIVLMQRVDDDEQDHQGSDSHFYYPPPPPNPGPSRRVRPLGSWDLLPGFSMLEWALSSSCDDLRSLPSARR